MREEGRPSAATNSCSVVPTLINASSSAVACFTSGAWTVTMAKVGAGTGALAAESSRGARRRDLEVGWLEPPPPEAGGSAFAVAPVAGIFTDLVSLSGFVRGLLGFLAAFWAVSSTLLKILVIALLSGFPAAVP